MGTRSIFCAKWVCGPSGFVGRVRVSNRIHHSRGNQGDCGGNAGSFCASAQQVQVPAPSSPSLEAAVEVLL